MTEPVREPFTTEQWEHLRSRAHDVSRRAYAPYSNYPVGAAALTEDGRIVTGTNVENAAYAATLHAESGLVSQLVATGGGKLVAFICVAGDGQIIMPCGWCRQTLLEHAAPGMEILTPQGSQSMEQILPQAFGPQNLSAVKPRLEA